MGSNDIPEGARKVAEKRMQGFLDFYGLHIRSVKLETLVESAYIQGLSDMATVLVERPDLVYGMQKIESDFQI